MHYSRIQKSKFSKQTKLIASIALALLVPVTAASTAIAQSGNASGTEQRFARPKFGKPANQNAQQDPWQFEGRLHLQEGSTEGYIVLQVDLAPGHYIYSVSPEGSPSPTKIEVVPSASVQTAESFSPDQPPLVIENDPVFQRRIEKHSGRVQFFVQCRLDPNSDYKQTGLPTIEFNGQVCSKDGVCIPIRKKTIPVSFAGYFAQEAAGKTSALQQTDSSVPSQAKASGSHTR